MHPATRCLLSPALAVLVVSSTFVQAQEAASDAAASPERAARIESTDPACQPAYPAAALKAGVTGTTKVRFVVSAAGQVTQAEIVRPSGPTLEHRLLDYAFEQALASCPYVPGVDWKGRAVGGTINATHVWQLPTAAAR